MADVIEINTGLKELRDDANEVSAWCKGYLLIAWDGTHHILRWHTGDMPPEALPLFAQDIFNRWEDRIICDDE